ncbi:hypothetical protein BGZ46_006430 [Entomortierella lignicola]|nr:hypothetical protein BGZ46_006430 [Entomortierella lignicola]
MTFIAFRRRFLIFLVPIINFIFLALYIFSPSSLPRLPRSLSLRSQRAAVVSSEHEPFEFISFDKSKTKKSSTGVIIDLVLGRIDNAGTNSETERVVDVNTGADSEKDSEPAPITESKAVPGSAPGSDGGFISLLEQRKLVKGIEVTPLPDHLITTYRPGYLNPLPASSANGATQPPKGSFGGQAQELEEDKVLAQEQSINFDPSTKFLTFLPHSGFHNQRTELENALLLARLLNRTLIMPKVYLGPPMPWLSFPQLHSRLLYQTKIGLEHCRAIVENQEEEEVEVVEYEEVIEQEKEPQTVHQLQQQEQQQDHHHHDHYDHHKNQQSNTEGQQESEEQSIQEDSYPTQYGGNSEEIITGNNDWEDLRDGQKISEDKSDEEESYNTQDDEVDLGGGRAAIRSSGIVVVETGEALLPSWIEEPDEEDEGRGSVATGAFIGDEQDLDLVDLEAIKEREKGDDDENEYDEDGDEVIEYTGDIQMGIIDDLDADDTDWEPESFVVADHKYEGNDKTRMLWEQLDKEASLPLYMPAIDSSVRDNIPRVWKRPFPGDSKQGNIYKRRTRVNKHEARLQERQMQVQDAIQGIPEEQVPSLQDHQTSLPQVKKQQVPVVKKQRRLRWTPLPAECLQYESWTMTDWDTFFDLNPLRHYVRILTRESMSMAYLAERFNLTFPKEEEDNQPKKNETMSDSLDGGSLVLADQEDKSEDSENESSGEEEEESKKVPLLRTEGDVLFFDDTSLYDYRFTENPDAVDSIKTRPKFGQEFTIDWLAQRPERLIHLGSIFGTGRVSIDSLDSKAWHLMVKDNLILGTDILHTISQQIVDRISGGAVRRATNNQEANPNQSQSSQDPIEPGFVGIHIRMSDGHFSLTARNTIENIRQELMWQMGITEDDIIEDDDDDDEDDDDDDDDGDDNESSQNTAPRSKKQGRLSMEQCRSRASDHRQALQEQLRQQLQQKDQQGQEQAFSRAKTPKRRSNGRHTPIYLATDAYRPRDNPIFDKLFATFECIFTLDDFSEDLELLHQFRNPEDGALMTKFMIPMVDTMVVAKSAAFFGTPASTFSNYIQRQLRPAFTGLYD